MSQSNNNYLTTGNVGGTISNNDYITYDTASYSSSRNSEFDGDVKINGRLIVDGDIYHKDDKQNMNTEIEHDIEVEVVDNGFMVTMGERKYAFSDLEEMDKWILDNLKTPDKAKEAVIDASGITKAQRDLLRGFEKITRQPQSNPFGGPYVGGNNPIQQWELDHQIRGNPIDGTSTGTPIPGQTWTTCSSNNSKSLLNKIFKRKGTSSGKL